jgi:hypothetical protein
MFRKNHRALKVFLLILTLWIIFGWPQYAAGMFVVALVILAFLWALTYILRGIFPWAYPPTARQAWNRGNTLGLVPPVEADLPPQSALIAEMPEMKCRGCRNKMEPVASLPGWYCWHCGMACEIDGDNLIWYTRK